MIHVLINKPHMPLWILPGQTYITLIYYNFRERVVYKSISIQERLQSLYHSTTSCMAVLQKGTMNKIGLYTSIINL